jgi:hypothetical protein
MLRPRILPKPKAEGHENQHETQADTYSRARSGMVAAPPTGPTRGSARVASWRRWSEARFTWQHGEAAAAELRHPVGQRRWASVCVAIEHRQDVLDDFHPAANGGSPFQCLCELLSGRPG